jgi:3-methylfumaryl-CoA hydratase
MTSSLDIGTLRQWIGREERASDTVAPRLVRSLRATLDQDPGDPQVGEPAPLAVHWCLAPAIAVAGGLGPDGHPARGGFLPPVPLPRRMWAGSALDIADDLRVGDVVERISRIADVTLKEGRTGQLCFVSVDHEFSTPRGIALRERQNIVYRDLDRRENASTPTTKPAAAPATKPTWQRQVRGDPVLLFRYSALTFNGHRIHYDRSYCVEEESYPGLIVHGPLQATLLLMLAASVRGGVTPKRFEFRGVNPLFDGGDFTVNAIADGDDLDLWVADRQGQATMKGQARW